MRKKEYLSKEEVLDLLRAQGETLLPPDGGWVVFYGSVHSKRGRRVPPELREVGVQHMDIYWGYAEEFPWSLSAYYKDEEDLSDIICDNNGITDEQLTLVTLHTPASTTVKAWKGELRWFAQALIDDMLAQGYLEVVPIGAMNKNPIWDDETKDMIGAMMLDGYSVAQAQMELVKGGVDVGELVKPNWFYRAAGEYRDTYCEEY